MKICFLLSTILYLSAIFAEEPSAHTPQEALKRLIEGNKRYVSNLSQHPNRSEERRKEIASKQTPYAVIVGCSDSRVSPEILFDEGLGDLFIVRVAGNVIGPIELESIAYSALALKSVLILILGHENCGAVDAVLQNKTNNIEEIAAFIKPAIRGARGHETDGLLKQAIKANALNMKKILEKTPQLQQLIQNKKIGVHAAYYNLTTGLIEVLAQPDT